MCGIYCSIHRDGSDILGHEYTKELLLNRGPDGFSEIEIKLINGWCGVFAGSTLWTQGLSVRKQPLVSTNGSVFLWNGDKYENIPGETECINDGEEVFSNISTHGIEYLLNISGPYAFIYFDAVENALWLGRDVLGRHSLLWSLASHSVCISSLGLSCNVERSVQEVTHAGLFKINFSEPEMCVKFYPWFHVPLSNDVNIVLPFLFETSLRHKILNTIFGDNWLDIIPDNSYVIKHEGPLSEEMASHVFQNALNKFNFLNITENLESLLFSSVRERIQTQPKFCKDCLTTQNLCNHSKTGILFSGGLDSAILALIAHRFVDEGEPIDLYNVSFQRTSNHKYENVPDRINGFNTLKELRSLCPTRTWNFIEINVSQAELNNEREKHISKLIHPLTSVLDDSLGCALWFAARGKGLVNSQAYTSPARVVLLGMGADEMFGGYTQHRKSFSTSGWKGLGRELVVSLSQIGKRNLGRDNRVVADHGRQPRTPYLQEQLVAFVNTLPPWQRCFVPPLMPLGIGDKFLLRLLAWKLGLRQAAILPKKALQFGSHIANPKEKGHLNSDRLSHS